VLNWPQQQDHYVKFKMVAMVKFDNINVKLTTRIKIDQLHV
jgi:hypothetical protein